MEEMREYQPKKENPYWLPKAVYYQAVYAVRDYDRLRDEYKSILHESAGGTDGQPRSTKTGHPTEKKVERLADISEKISAIEHALHLLPDEYRNGVFNNVRYQSPYPYIAGRATWSRHRRRFLFLVAKNLHLF